MTLESITKFLEALRSWWFIVPIIVSLGGFGWFQTQEIKRVQTPCTKCVPVADGWLCMCSRDTSKAE